MKIEDCYKIGHISKTHGLKGEVTAVFENEFEFGDVDALFLEFSGNLVPYFIEKVTGKGTKPFLKLEGINTQPQALEIKGCHLYLPKSTRPKLKRGLFYDDEVVGFLVEDEVVGLLGNVTEVQNSGANRLLVFNFNGKEILVPINSPFILNVNKSRKSIKLQLPDGYLDM